MGKLKILRDYMREGGANNKAFISKAGEIYIVKDFRLVGESYDIAVIDADWITQNPLFHNFRKRIGFPLSGKHNHLYDDKATFSQIKKARLECQVSKSF